RYPFPAQGRRPVATRPRSMPSASSGGQFSRGPSLTKAATPVIINLRFGDFPDAAESPATREKVHGSADPVECRSDRGTTTPRVHELRRGRHGDVAFGAFATTLLLTAAAPVVGFLRAVRAAGFTQTTLSLVGVSDKFARAVEAQRKRRRPPVPPAR